MIADILTKTLTRDKYEKMGLESPLENHDQNNR